MKNRPYLVLGILLVAALGWAAWQALREPREPVYEGHPIGYWFGSAKGLGGSSRLQPWTVHFARDSNATPFVIRMLKRDSWFGQAYYRKWLWPKLPTSISSHLPAPPADNPATREAAAVCLSLMGSGAKSAIPALTRALREDEVPRVRRSAAWALGTVALGSAGQRDKMVVAALSDALKDKDGEVRITAAHFLVRVDREAAARAGVKMTEMPSP
jgi:hypothetical protein